ncbi:MAG: metal transporter substrate-binding protein [Alphaproteobacteria bacterium]|nr:metal transporter substrate-binding protein [Alphaproteobacteria bacterium]
MDRLRALAALLLIFGLALAFAPLGQAQQRLKVVASFSILADMAREIGGDRIELRSLVGANGNAHVFQPTPADGRAVSEASVLIVNGLGFEGWIERLQRSARFKGKIVVASAGVSPALTADDHGHSHGHSPGGSASTRKKAKVDSLPDPHAWQDLRNGMLYVDTIARGLSEADPANAEFFVKRASVYKQRLAALDARLRSEFAAVPQGKRRVITSHDAFAYFGRAYGIEFIPAAGVSSESEPTPRQIAALITQIKKENVRALFVENMSSPKLVEQIGRDAGASVGGTLYSDALSPPGGPVDSYTGMFEHNAAALKAGMARN